MNSLLRKVFLCAVVSSVLMSFVSNDVLAQNGNITFSYHDVDVRLFVETIGSAIGRKFVIGDGVEGRITVVSDPIEKDKAFDLFVTVLESAGFSVLEEGAVFKIVPLPRSDTSMGEVVGPDEKIPSKGMVTKVFYLEHVDVEQLKIALQTRIGGGKAGAVSSIKETNHLVVSDTADNIRRVEKIISQIDKPGNSKTTEVVRLRFVGAEDLADQLNLAMSESETRAEMLRRRLSSNTQGSTVQSQGPIVVAAPHSSSIILVGTQVQIETLKTLVAKMDVDTPSGRGRFNAVFLKYVGAEEIAKSISGLLTASEKKGVTTGTRSQERMISIEPSIANNAVLIDASPGDFEVVKKLIDQLDVPPEQVHISVEIAELTVNDDFKFGVELAALDMPGEVGDSVVQGSVAIGDGAGSLLDSIQEGVFPDGISIGIAHGTSVDEDGNVSVGYPGLINIDALKQDGRIEMKSETALVAQNNKEATVSIVNEIPILKSTIDRGSGSASDVIQNIDRIEVGIKLNLTPRIIPGGEVQMELNPSIEAVVDSSSGELNYTPTIARRSVSTTVTVPDGEQIVIAGLTREDDIESVAKVPILGSIPIIGKLFTKTETSSKKTNLLILVTPTIVKDITMAKSVTDKWKVKTAEATDEKK